MEERTRTEMLTGLAFAFRPSGPVDSGDLFTGRVPQIIQIGNTLLAPARHGVIYGERGVGKTSMASVASEFFSLSMSIRINCDVGDSFSDIWCRVREEADLRSRLPSWPHGKRGREVVAAASAALGNDEVSPDRVRHYMRTLDELGLVAVFIDEYDQVADFAVHGLMAATIKTLSDSLVRSTMILVGVADDVDTLIYEHKSIERNLEEIPMPRMTYDEIREIVHMGYDKLGLNVEESTYDRLAMLPQGLPHFAHLLAQEAARSAVMDGRNVVMDSDLKNAIAQCVRSSEASLTHAYHLATDSAHGDALYESVLLACALAPVDDLGFFAPSDLLDPLQRIKGRRYEHASFARHLISFCDERGPVLERKGGDRHWRYRFVNPRLRPFVLMRSISLGLLNDDLLAIAPRHPASPQLPFG